MFANFVKKIWAGDLAGVGAAAGDALALASVIAGAVAAQVVTFVEEEDRGLNMGGFTGRYQPETSAVEEAQHPEAIKIDKPGAVRPWELVMDGGDTKNRVQGAVRPEAFVKDEKVVAWPDNTSRKLIAGNFKSAVRPQILAAGEEEIDVVEEASGGEKSWVMHRNKLDEVEGQEVPMMRDPVLNIVEEAKDERRPVVMHRSGEVNDIVEEARDERRPVVMHRNERVNVKGQEVSMTKVEKKEDSFDDKKRMNDDVDLDINKCKFKKSHQQDKSEAISEKEGHSKGKEDKENKVKVKSAVDSSVESKYKSSTDVPEEKVCEKSRSTVGVSRDVEEKSKGLMFKAKNIEGYINHVILTVEGGKTVYKIRHACIENKVGYKEEFKDDPCQVTVGGMYREKYRMDGGKGTVDLQLFTYVSLVEEPGSLRLVMDQECTEKYKSAEHMYSKKYGMDSGQGAGVFTRLRRLDVTERGSLLPGSFAGVSWVEEMSRLGRQDVRLAGTDYNEKLAGMVQKESRDSWKSFPKWGCGVKN